MTFNQIFPISDCVNELINDFTIFIQPHFGTILPLGISVAQCIVVQTFKSSLGFTIVQQLQGRRRRQVCSCSSSASSTNRYYFPGAWQEQTPGNRPVYFPTTYIESQLGVMCCIGKIGQTTFPRYSSYHDYHPRPLGLWVIDS